MPTRTITDNEIHRLDLPTDVRNAVEKTRGDALVAAVLALGGELTLTPEVLERARGHDVILDFPNGLARFRTRPRSR